MDEGGGEGGGVFVRGSHAEDLPDLALKHQVLFDDGVDVRSEPGSARKGAGLYCGSSLRSGEVFAYVGSPQNLKDLSGSEVTLYSYAPLRVSI